MKKLGKKVVKTDKSLKAFWGRCTCYCTANLYNTYSMDNGTGY